MKRSGTEPPSRLSSTQWAELEASVRAGTSFQRPVTGAKMVQLLAAGLSEAEVTRRPDICRATATRWRESYAAGGCRSWTESFVEIVASINRWYPN